MRAFFSLTAIIISLNISPLALTAGQAASSPDNNSTITDTYPHISALENAILGQSYPAQALTDRLSRMEKKAFGSASNNPDLSARTDALDDYTDKQLHKKLLQANTDAEGTIDSNTYSTTNTNGINDDQPVQNQAEYPHITSLEQTILGQTYAGEPLANRLSRMEAKAFGNGSANPDLSSRTDALEAYAEKTLHKQPAINNTEYDDSPETARNNSGGLLSKVGQTLLGMATGPGLGGMGGIGGMPGMGNGFGGGGMGRGMGRGNYNRQAQQEPEPPPVKHEDDPAVFLPTPPDANAKLQIKVGWCEVHVFAHTFPDMHLTARLGQLNKELHLEPGKSNIQLMDDIGLMIKAVQARKQ